MKLFIVLGLFPLFSAMPYNPFTDNLLDSPIFQQWNSSYIFNPTPSFDSVSLDPLGLFPSLSSDSNLGFQTRTMSKTLVAALRAMSYNPSASETFEKIFADESICLNNVEELIQATEEGTRLVELAEGRIFAACLGFFRVASTNVDVVIVGAGTSGLAAAKSLVEARPGLKIMILEQRSRVGGRTKNLEVPGYPGIIMEGGGTWLGPTQDHALNLTKELGLELYHSWYNYPGMDPHTSTPQCQLPSNATQAAIAQIEHIAAEVGTEAPWAHPKAAEYDALSLGDWLKQAGFSKQVQDEMAENVAIPLGAHSVDDFSFLFYLFFSASCPFCYDVGLYGGAQDFRLVRGSQAISDALLELVEQAGVQVLFNTSVQHVSIADDGVTLLTSKGHIEAMHAIIAMGTGDARRLSYAGLTPAREEFHARWINNVGMKFFFVFDRAFWRDHGLLGKPIMPVYGMFFDYTPFNKTSPGIIAGFFQDNILPFGGKAGRRAFLETMLTSGLGLRTPFKVEAYVEQNWDLNTEGGTANIVQYLDKGVLSKVGSAWRAPIGRLHWAGSDTAQKWMGYISGAVESGKRTAQEVLGDMSADDVTYV